ncbi:hypothetical protein CE91St62_39110 [Lachnospiraceae bacterium]|uniref:DUF5038 domain-containing protein n=1 Tax=Extibacter sp. GGCC_0201 TaxID=2731209 RepID=UPI001AA14FF0|nr:DUF5038 domain-containing protein [Extibacter sp. GGCC_0201]MBO1720726.1 DUF5038 domain-containing protein [Extibacter sp. GGCC_0201]BDF35849.1 hypothetical protein CE91St61_39240 [Lachnospiraceae bacterium]BDF39850.1 hypothetical protein CE91St62_39110 [Lachnospiraceae bacterium]
MNKMKLILAVLLFAALIFVGIILPVLLKKEPAPRPEAPALSDSFKTEPDALPELTFDSFEALKDIMAEVKIDELKEQIPQYFQSKGLTEITSAAFLSEQTEYPNAGEIKLVFKLSDETTLPVYCDRAGRFLFGEERIRMTEETKVYEKPTDDTLPLLTTSDIEKRQEGGYPDTTSTPADEEKKED